MAFHVIAMGSRQVACSGSCSTCSVSHAGQIHCCARTRKPDVQPGFNFHQLFLRSYSIRNANRAKPCVSDCFTDNTEAFTAVDLDHVDTLNSDEGSSISNLDVWEDGVLSVNIKPKQQTMLLGFKVHFESKPGDTVVVTGSTPALGSWELEAAAPLRWTEGHIWESIDPVPVESGSTLQYKYVVLCEDGSYSIQWCQGQNLSLDLPTTGSNWIALDAWNPNSTQVVQVDLVEAGATSACAADCSLHEGFPFAIPFRCFLCGHCAQPHLHTDHCPLGYDEIHVEPVRHGDGQAGGTHSARHPLPTVPQACVDSIATSTDRADGDGQCFQAKV